MGLTQKGGDYNDPDAVVYDKATAMRRVHASCEQASSLWCPLTRSIVIHVGLNTGLTSMNALQDANVPSTSLTTYAPYFFLGKVENTLTRKNLSRSWTPYLSGFPNSSAESISVLEDADEEDEDYNIVLKLLKDGDLGDTTAEGWEKTENFPDNVEL